MADTTPDLFNVQSRVTRVEVIDETGRRFVQRYAAGVFVQVQDDGRTLKVFAGTPEREADRG